MLRPFIISLMASAVVCSLLGCGLKGPLVLPQKTAPAVVPAPVPAAPENAEDKDKPSTEQNKNDAAAGGSNNTNSGK